jgi:putative hemolysin
MTELGEILRYAIPLVVLIAASAFFSGSEVALFGLRRVDREQLVRSDRPSDSLVVRMLAKPRQLIATLLIGNEVVNVSVSAVVASLVSSLYPAGSELELALFATSTAVLLLLFLGEITPKTIAIKTSLGWSRKAARPLWLFGTIVTPLRWVVRLVADLLMRPFGGSTLQAMPRDLSEAEFKALVDASSALGEVDARERRFIHRVFEFDDKTVAQVMMPRKKIFALAYDLPTARLVEAIAAGGFSRVPIYKKSLDQVRGIVYAKDLVIQGIGMAAPRRLVDLLHEPLFVPRTIPIERLFRIFKQRKIHMAIVVNEYGKVVGLVTMEDLLEELFGEIYDEREQQKASVRPDESAAFPRQETADVMASSDGDES